MTVSLMPTFFHSVERWQSSISYLKACQRRKHKKKTPEKLDALRESFNFEKDRYFFLATTFLVTFLATLFTAFLATFLLGAALLTVFFATVFLATTRFVTFFTAFLATFLLGAAFLTAFLTAMRYLLFTMAVKLIPYSSLSR